MILAIYRGNGLTELINWEGPEHEHEDRMEEPPQINKPGSSNISASGGNRGTVKGVFVGRDGRAVLLDHLLCGRRKK